MNLVSKSYTLIAATTGPVNAARLSGTRTLLKGAASTGTKILGVVGALFNVMDVIFSWAGENPNREQGERSRGQLIENIEELSRF